jgi:predicted nucleic acid-binding Zn ribbon protein
VPLRVYEGECGLRVERIEPAGSNQKFLLRDCEECRRRHRFERAIGRTSFSLKGGVGSGWHTTDYPKPNSDLVKGRGKEFESKVDEMVEKRNKMVAQTRAAHKKKRSA